LRLHSLGALFEIAAFTTQSELDCFVSEFARAKLLGALSDDPLHVGTLVADYSPGYLEFWFVINLDIKPASVLDVTLLGLLIILFSLNGLLILLSF
jgi:hypothetical protein